MNAFDWLKHRWTTPAAPSTSVAVDPSHVDLGDGRTADATTLVAGTHYFRVWLVAMSLGRDRGWFTASVPAAYSIVRFTFGDHDATIAHVAGQTLLHQLDESALGRRLGLDYAMTPLAPFNGGTVEIDMGLLAAPRQDAVAALLNALGGFSRVLLASELSPVLPAADALADGLAAFVRATGAAPVLRWHTTFTPGDGADASPLRTGYVLLSSAPEREIDPAQVWISRDRPLYGASLEKARPLSGHDYMLVRIEAPTRRDDWDALKSIEQPYQDALALLQQAAYASGDDQQSMLRAAELHRDAAKIAALRAPELTRPAGRNQVVDAVMRGFGAAKKAANEGSAETAAPASLASAVRGGMSVGEALAAGNIPDWAWLTMDRPLPMAGAPPRPARAMPGRTLGAPPPHPAAGGDAVHVSRTPHMDVVAAQPLKPAQAFKVRVYADQIAARAGEEVTEIAVTAPAGTTTIALEVWISGTEQFEFPGPRVQPFVIDLRTPAAVPSAEFDVKVRDDAPASATGKLFANFSYQGRPSGRVATTVTIGAGAQPAAAAAEELPPPPHTIRVDASAKIADLTIEVTDPQNTKQHLQCRVWSPHLNAGERGVPFAWDLDRDTADLVKTYMGEFVKPDIEADERLLNLQGAGRQLWDATPQPLKDAFWKLVDLDTLDTIQIASEEPFIPWELMIPRRGTTTLQPLGAEFVVGRWLPRDFVAAPQELPLQHSLVVAPAYGPPPDPPVLQFAADEAKLVLDTVGGDLVEPANSANVRNKLAAGGASLVHFVCHGSDSESFGIQVIILKSSQLTSLQLAGMANLPAAFTGRPLVFLNACEVGRLSAALVGVGGFAKAFLDAGAGAVIAPLWSVKDSIAHQIAEAFYQRLKAGARVRPAEILRDIRRQAYVTTGVTSGEDTYAAYCFYGDPDAVAFIK